MTTGYFITLEGPEGGGKTLHTRALAEYLHTCGYPVLRTREPGGTSIGDQVREVLMGLKNTAMHPRTEALLFQASRAQLVAELIRPALAGGQVVLCDRYADSTLAYQGYGHQLFSLAELGGLIGFATGGLQPDLTLLLDVDVETGLQRKLSEGEWNRLDAYDVAFHQRVRQGYLELAAADPQRWLIIDAGRPLPAVQQAIFQAVLERVAGRAGR
ncbi:MAG: dTMP kinase [Chloroflexota bacterium]